MKRTASPPPCPRAPSGGGTPSKGRCRAWLPLPRPVRRPEPWPHRLGGERGRRSVTLEVQGDPALFLKLFALIQRSDYIQITSLRQRDLAPDPWERDFRVRGAGKRLL